MKVKPLPTTAEPVVRTPLRPLVRDAIPLVRALPAPRAVLAASTPNLHGTFPTLNHFVNVLTYIVNELLYNPPVPDARRATCSTSPGSPTTAASLLSIQDAHGVFRPVAAGAP